MTEERDDPTSTGAAAPLSAGALLRAAREQRGLHIAALAAAMKVAPRTLEALEADRHEELLDLGFTRALAQTVCRALKVDPAPILARLPQASDAAPLAQVGAGLNTPFRDRPGRRDPADFFLLRRPIVWATGLVVLATVALAMLPPGWLSWRTVAADVISAPLSAPLPASAATLPASAATLASAPTNGLAASAANADPRHSVLALSSQAVSWVDVQDASGRSLLSRNLVPGETVGLNGELPLRLTIGNAAATRLLFRGQPVDLSARTRDNVAHLQLP